MHVFSLSAIALASARAVDDAQPYVLSDDPGGSTVRFGDGIRGVVPSACHAMHAAYRAGAGEDGNVPTVTGQPHPATMLSALTAASLDPRMHYVAVSMQQGRVQTDADSGEAAGIGRRDARLLDAGVAGSSSSGGSEPRA
jgi:hypothetical protein